MADEQNRFHRLFQFLVFPIDVSRVVRRIEHAGDPVLALDFVPVDTRVENSRFRVFHDQNPDGNVFPGIFFRMFYYRYAIDMRKIEQNLGYRPLLNFEAGLIKTVDWYLDNEDWWKSILDGSYQQK